MCLGCPCNQKGRWVCPVALDGDRGRPPPSSRPYRIRRTSHLHQEGLRVRRNSTRLGRRSRRQGGTEVPAARRLFSRSTVSGAGLFHQTPDLRLPSMMLRVISLVCVAGVVPRFASGCVTQPERGVVFIVRVAADRGSASQMVSWVAPH